MPMPAKGIAAVFQDLLLVEHVTVDRAAAVSHALQWYRRGLDFADALHLAPSAPCESLATFDAGFAKAARRLGLRPVVTKPG